MVLAWCYYTVTFGIEVLLKFIHYSWIGTSIKYAMLSLVILNSSFK